MLHEPGPRADVVAAHRAAAISQVPLEDALASGAMGFRSMEVQPAQGAKPGAAAVAHVLVVRRRRAVGVAARREQRASAEHLRGLRRVLQDAAPGQLQHHGPFGRVIGPANLPCLSLPERAAESGQLLWQQQGQRLGRPRDSKPQLGATAALQQTNNMPRQRGELPSRREPAQHQLPLGRRDLGRLPHRSVGDVRSSDSRRAVRSRAAPERLVVLDGDLAVLPGGKQRSSPRQVQPPRCQRRACLAKAAAAQGGASELRLGRAPRDLAVQRAGGSLDDPQVFVLLHNAEVSPA
jgi:hypothetical protein